MLTPDYLLRISEGAEQIASELHSEIVERIVERIAIRLGRGDDYILTPIDKWQLEVLVDAGYLLEDLQELIAKKTRLQRSEIKQAFEDAGVKSADYDDEVYKAAGLSPTPLLQSPHMIRLLQRGYEATQGEWINFTRTTAQAAQQLFIRECDKAYHLVSSGALGYAQAVKEAVDTIAADGVVVTYPSGHTDTIETATLRAVRTGISQSCAEITDARMDEMDWDIILVSAHLGARVTDREDYTNHYWWQGKFYSKSGADDRFPSFEVCGMGDVQGIHGANCRHSHGPGDGVHNPFKQFDAEENAKLYELQQHQRLLERRIRKTKREVMAEKKFVDTVTDPETKSVMETEYQKKAALLQKQNAQYKEFCEKNNLKPLQDRLRIANWDRKQAAAARGAAKKHSGTSTKGGKIEIGSVEWYNKRDEQAAAYYERVRTQDDIEVIAHKSGMSPEDISIIKDHVFYNTHMKYDGEIERFDPDYDMAVAWQRLATGTPEDTDFLLLKHELLESRLEREYNLTAAAAHAMADEVYAWDKAIIEKFGGLGEKDDLLQFE